MQKLIENLTTDYNTKPEARADFAERARAAIKAYKPEAERKKEAIDKDRLGQQAKALSQLRLKLLSTANWSDGDKNRLEAAENKLAERYPMDGADYKNIWDEWFNDSDTLKQALAIQQSWRQNDQGSDLRYHIAKLDILPPELRLLRLSDVDEKNWKKLSAERLKRKSEKVPNIDVDAMMKKVLPGLKGNTFYQVVSALLLATGRRSVEILKSGVFTHAGEYKITFSGQAKTRGNAEAYDIDVLAPAELCIAALGWVRRNIDCTAMTHEQVNLKYANRIGAAVAATCQVRPHDLRGINAVACWHLYGQDKSITLYIKEQLGHSSTGSAERYQTWKIAVTAAWKPGTTELKEEDKGSAASSAAIEAPTTDSGLSYWSAPSGKVAYNVGEMMRAKHVITKRSVARVHGHSPGMLVKFLAYGNNQKIIDEHNASILSQTPDAEATE